MNNILISVVMRITTILALTFSTAFAEQIRDPFVPLLPIEENIPPPAINHTLPLDTNNEVWIEKIFKLVSIKAQEVQHLLGQPEVALLSPKATIRHEATTNSVIIKDSQERLTLIEDWIKQKDLPQQQVQITAHIISSSKTALQELGLEWGLQAGNTTHNRLNRYNRYHSAPGQFSFNVLKLSEGLLEMKLNALEKENLLSIIASPRLMASHQQPASIQQGTEIPYVTSSEKKTHVQFKDAVLGMDVTPTIIRDEKVELNLKISHNSPDTALTSSQNHHLAINKQEIATSVTIKNNETLILGGIFQQKQEKTQTGIPFLSQVPLLGALFTNSAEHVDRRVLVVFITPKLINI